GRRGGLMTMGGGWVLEVDIRSFFDTLDHGQLRTILRKRVQDRVLLRLIGTWLHAGVMENGGVTYPDSGTPQGGVISPLLANVFLHEVLDTWFENEVKPRLRGRAFLVRYADDVTAVFSQEEDARRVWAVVPKRLAGSGLLAARGALPESPRPLQLLWDHRELGGDHAVPLRSAHPVAEVVESPRRTGPHVLA